MNLRVLFVTGEYPPLPGGIGEYTAQVAEGLASAGLSVGVLTTQRVRPDTVAGGVVAVDASIRHWGWSSFPAIRRALARGQPDLVHIQYQAAAFGMHPAPHLLPWWLHRQRHVHVAVTFHDLRVPYLFPKAGPLRRRSLQLLAGSCDAIVTTNEADRRDLLGWTGTRGRGPEPVVIPLGNAAPSLPLSASQRAAMRSRLGAGEGDTLVCFFGLLNQSKGVEDLLHAVARLRDDGQPMRLLFLGGMAGASDPTDAAGLEQARAQVAALGLDRLATWTGYLPREELGPCLEAADMAAFPYTDGASLRRTSLIAALSHGLPVVTTDPEDGAGGPLKHEENCLLVPRRDDASLAAALRRLAGGAALRARLPAGARAAARPFDWDSVVAAHRRLYASLGDGTPD